VLVEHCLNELHIHTKQHLGEPIINSPFGPKRMITLFPLVVDRYRMISYNVKSILHSLG
jgi:hypothetical protein